MVPAGAVEMVLLCLVVFAEMLATGGLLLLSSVVLFAEIDASGGIDVGEEKGLRRQRW